MCTLTDLRRGITLNFETVQLKKKIDPMMEHLTQCGGTQRN